MAISKPDVTIIDLPGGANNALDLITELNTHWNGVSTKFALTAGVTLGAGSSVNVTPLGAGETWQVNLRRTSTTAFQSQLDPSATITNAGNTGAGPTGASTMAGPELGTFTLNSATAALRVLLLEWADCFAILPVDTTSAFFPTALKIGKIQLPFFQGNGVDGLGFLGGAPSFNSWFGTGGGTLSRVRVGATGVQATDWLTPYAYDATQSSNLRGGIYQLQPFVFTTTAYMGAAGAQPCGLPKYLFGTAQARSPLVRLQDTSGDEFCMYIGSAGSAYRWVIAWPDATDPLA